MNEPGSLIIQNHIERKREKSMNKFLRKAMILALAGTMTLGMGSIALAEEQVDDVTRDAISQFTEDGVKASTGVDSFYLIKDYDSFDKTSESPSSASPAETFTYKITPYAVWNAGSTYSAQSTFTGTATAITTANMPMLTLSDGKGVSGEGVKRTLTVDQTVSIGDAKYESTPDTRNTGDKKTEIKLPTYETVGDYWYKVEEQLGTTTGVLYGTNSTLTSGSTTDVTAANGNHNRTYYIHVQVTETSNAAGTSELVKNVTMHKTAPDASLLNARYNDQNNTNDYYTQDNKVNAIENRYYAGELVIKKEVTGNAGDKDQYFEVTVVFTKPEGTVVNSDIPFTAVAKSGNDYTSTNFVIKGQNSMADTTGKTVINWTGTEPATAERTATCTFYVKDDTTVTFSNIPYGIDYTIKETQPANDTYTHSFAFADTNDGTAKFDNVVLTTDGVTAEDSSKSGEEKWDAAGAAGSITDHNDTVTITNNKVSTIDVGVITSNAPYAAMLVFAGLAVLLYVRRRKNMIEE